jgi:hypothetical protein
VAKIVNAVHNSESPVKHLSSAVPNEDSKKLKIQLADSLFELKKIEEDFAEFKRNSKVEHEKEVKKY